MRAEMMKEAWECMFSRPPWPFITQFLVLTGIHYGLPLAAPLAELLGVLLFYLCSLDEAGHNVIASLERLFSSLHCVYIISRLRGETEKWKDGDDM